ncbi:hypothetical protein AB0H71_28900 [Nocardia sp. NPDC050697]|uniref:hypothetical protein n=1 Tax=Nocardia sp. NPDC050697 TaxID=3155158 RepID=UPI0033FB3CB3
MTTYRVNIVKAFPEGINARSRFRSGIEVLADGGYEGELTPEQLKAIKADEYLEVVPATEAAASAGDVKTDALLAEAKEEAKAIVAQAKQKASAIVRDAEAEAKDKVKAAEVEAKEITNAAKEAAKTPPVQNGNQANK